MSSALALCAVEPPWAKVLRALDSLPCFDRERVVRAVIADVSIDVLLGELRTVEPGDYAWDDLVELAARVIATDQEGQDEDLAEAAP